LKYAERAAGLDPDSPFAYAALALVHASLPEHLYFQPAYASALNEATSAAATLQRLDPASYVASYVAGIVCLRRQQPDQALANLKRAYELNPNDCLVLRWLAWAEFNLNLGAEAYAHCTQALRLGPRDPLRHLTFWGLAYASFVMGRAREGADWARQAVSEGPTHYPSYAILAACLAEAGDLNAARLPIEHLMRHRRDYICSRLEGHNYFGVPELSERFTSALRRAAGPAFAGIHSVPQASRSSAARRSSQRSAAGKKKQMALRAVN
jgi:tetratricopeptide (TPR) repeat protein